MTYSGGRFRAYEGTPFDCECYPTRLLGEMEKLPFRILSTYAWDNGGMVGFTWAYWGTGKSPANQYTSDIIPTAQVTFQNTWTTVTCKLINIHRAQHPIWCEVPLAEQILLAQRNYTIVDVGITQHGIYYFLPNIKICLSVQPPDAPPERVHDIAICTALKNNSAYLVEFVEWYKHVGIDHFYIYDDGSTDHPEHVLREYMCEGLVTIVPWNFSSSFATTPRSRVSEQWLAHNDCSYRFRDQMKYSLVLDTDELLLLPPTVSSVKDILRDYEYKIDDPDYYGLRVCTHRMGAPKDIQGPIDDSQPVTKQYPLRSPDPMDPKCIFLNKRVDYLIIHSTIHDEPKLEDPRLDMLHYFGRRVGRLENTTGWVDVSDKVWNANHEWLEANMRATNLANMDSKWTNPSYTKNCKFEYHLNQKCPVGPTVDY